MTEKADRDGVRDDQLTHIAHDLKSPLTSLSLCVSMCRLKMVEPRADVLDLLTVMERNIAFIDRLVCDVVDLSTVDNAQIRLQRSPCDLGVIIEAVRDRAFLNEPRIEFELARDSVISIIDGRRIERVLANLIENALKYAAAASSILVRLEYVDGWSRISVQESESGRSHDGDSLGLYVSRKIIEAHGGRIGVEGDPGVGARFIVELPTHVPRIPTRSSLQGLRVLLVDGVLEGLLPLADLLRREGLVPTVATSVIEALVEIADKLPDIVVLDDELSDTSGLTLLAHLNDRIPQIPLVVMVRTSPPDPNRVATLEATGARWVPKPVEGNQLCRLLADTLCDA